MHCLVAFVGRGGSGALSARNRVVSRLEQYPNMFSVMCFSPVDIIHVLLITFRPFPRLVEFLFVIFANDFDFGSYRHPHETVIVGVVRFYSG